MFCVKGRTCNTTASVLFGRSRLSLGHRCPFSVVTTSVYRRQPLPAPFLTLACYTNTQWEHDLTADISRRTEFFCRRHRFNERSSCCFLHRAYKLGFPVVCEPLRDKDSVYEHSVEPLDERWMDDALVAFTCLRLISENVTDRGFMQWPLTPALTNTSTWCMAGARSLINSWDFFKIRHFYLNEINANQN